MTYNITQHTVISEDKLCEGKQIEQRNMHLQHDFNISVDKYHNGNIHTKVELNLASSNLLTLQQNIASHLHTIN